MSGMHGVRRFRCHVKCFSSIATWEIIGLRRQSNHGYLEFRDGVFPWSFSLSATLFSCYSVENGKWIPGTQKKIFSDWLTIMPRMSSECDGKTPSPHAPDTWWQGQRRRFTPQNSLGEIFWPHISHPFDTTSDTLRSSDVPTDLTHVCSACDL